MMKTLLVAAAVVLLAGCVAVPVYSVPAPGPPIATFSFGYHNHRGGPRHD